MHRLLQPIVLAILLAAPSGALAQTLRFANAHRVVAHDAATGKVLRGFELSPGGSLALNATGPGWMLVYVRAVGDAGPLTLTVNRDYQAESVNVRNLSAGGGATLERSKLSQPAVVEFSIPAGAHDYRFEASRTAFVQIGPSHSAHPQWAAATEQPLAAPVVVAPLVTDASAPRTIEASSENTPHSQVPATELGDVAAARESLSHPARATPTLILTPVVGFGWTVEDQVDEAVPQMELGADVSYLFSDSAALELVFRDHSSSQIYVTTLGGGAPLTTNEQMIQADLDFRYSFHPLDRLTLSAFAGPGFRFFSNPDVPSQIGGLAPGGEMTILIAKDLDVSARGSYLYNLFFPESSSISVMGAPQAAADFSAALGMHFSGGSRLRLAYEGEDDVFARSYRYYHSLAFLFDIAI
ncbi:MAG: hypothetical protein ACYCWW_18635 [Deltaproteobacteria bacterium]